MSVSDDSDGLTYDKIGVFLLYLFSFLLGVISTWVIVNFPLFRGPITAVKIGQWIVTIVGLASLVAASFSKLTQKFVINPLEERVKETTAERPLSESPEGSGSNEDLELDTQTRHTVEETLNQLGYDTTSDANNGEADDT